VAKKDHEHDGSMGGGKNPAALGSLPSCAGQKKEDYFLCSERGEVPEKRGRMDRGEKKKGEDANALDPVFGRTTQITTHHKHTRQEKRKSGETRVNGGLGKGKEKKGGGGFIHFARNCKRKGKNEPS